MNKKVVETEKKITKQEVKPKSYRFSQETLDLLDAISKQERRSATNMLEVLVAEKAAALGITPAKG